MKSNADVCQLMLSLFDGDFLSVMASQQP